MVPAWMIDLSKGPKLPHLSIGKIVRHPTGDLVEILGGSYDEGPITNLWSWVKLRADGTRSEEIGYGVGWHPVVDANDEAPFLDGLVIEAEGGRKLRVEKLYHQSERGLIMYWGVTPVVIEDPQGN